MKFFDAHPIDFAAVVRELLNHGVTKADINLWCRASRNSANAWLKGAQPKFENGRALLVLWHETTQRPLDTVLAPRRVNGIAQPAARLR